MNHPPKLVNRGTASLQTKICNEEIRTSRLEKWITNQVARGLIRDVGRAGIQVAFKENVLDYVHRITTSDYVISQWLRR